jgi:hypothetical protein
MHHQATAGDGVDGSARTAHGCRLLVRSFAPRGETNAAQVARLPCEY